MVMCCNSTILYPQALGAVFQALAIMNMPRKKRQIHRPRGVRVLAMIRSVLILSLIILGSGLEVITPIRDLKLSRQGRGGLSQKHGVEFSWEKAQYSINKGSLGYPA